MAAFTYNFAKRKIWEADINFLTDTIKMMLTMTNSEADVEDDAEFVGDITVLDEYDGANYTADGITLTTKVITNNFGSDEIQLSCDDVTWTALGAGTRANQGAIIWKDTGNNATSPLIMHSDLSFTGQGLDLIVQIPATGFLRQT